MSSISCIIPFHNEKNRLDRVLKELTQIRAISEIICVNDGSTDDGEKNLTSKFPSVKLYGHSRRRGKSEAVRTGFKQASSEIILMMDADHQRLQHEEIEAAIRYFEKNPQLDMLILPDNDSFWTTHISRHDILFAGKRILHKKDLNEIFAKYKPHAYQLETAINTYMMESNKKVAFSYISCRNTWKTEKIGLLPGMRDNLKMLSNIWSYKNLGQYVKQILFFGHERVKMNDSTT